MLRRTAEVHFACNQINLQRSKIGGRARERHHRLQQLVGTVQTVGAFPPFPDQLRITLLAENLFPHGKTAGDMRISIRLPLLTGHQQKQSRSGTERTARGRSRSIICAESFVEIPQPGPPGEMCLLGARGSRENIEIGG